MKQISPSDKFLSRKRLKKRLHRAEVIAGRPRGPIKARPLVFHRDSLLGWLRDTLDVPEDSKRRDLQIVIPEDFSVLTNPRGLVSTLTRLVSMTRRPHTRAIFFDHNPMRRYDLAAERCIDIVAEELERMARFAGRALRIGGRYPPDETAKRFLRSIGIVRQLRVTGEFLSAREQDKLQIFNAHRRQGAEDVVFGTQDRKSLETQRFVDHIDNCLKHNGRRLTASGIERLSSYTGEVLANAEEHSARGEWLLTGYLDNAASGHMCEIAVLSFGSSFSDTFLKLPIDSYPWKQIEPYMLAHGEGRLFSKKWAPEDLLTLVALQGGVSSRNRLPEDTRGQGTIDLISFFERMHTECQGRDGPGCEMAILSGNTHLRFDGKYRLGRDSTNREVIAFNEENSLERPPDPEYVTHIDDRFPGTVISIRFPLQSGHTKLTS